MPEEVQPGSNTVPAPPRASSASELPARQRGGFLGRLREVLQNELGGLHLRLRLIHVILFFCPHYCLVRVRTALYRLCGIRIGARTLILGTLDLSGIAPIWERLQIGEDCHINTPCYLDMNADIRIGNHVAIGHHAVFVTTDHDTDDPNHRCGPRRFAPIVIEDGCWIGARVTILPGVTIGRGSVVSAGSVVFADVPPNKVVGGVPARPIRTLAEETV